MLDEWGHNCWDQNLSSSNNLEGQISERSTTAFGALGSISQMIIISGAILPVI